MKELGVFIDESGDFGDYDPASPYYIISIVIHSQENDISEQIRNFTRSLENTELKRDFVHVGPLIRKENEYRYMGIPERLKILRRLVKFTEKIDIKQESFYIEKKHISDENHMIQKLARQLSGFLKDNYVYFSSFNEIKLYYDSGQEGVVKIILTVFTALFSNVTYKNSAQKDYRLLQVADLVCTAKLTELKLENNMLSRSEKNVLGDNRAIKRTLLAPINKKKF